MDAGIGFLMVLGMILAIIGLVHYYKNKYPVRYNIKEAPQRNPVPGPQGPRPPKGLPGPITLPPPGTTFHMLTGDYGPDYLTGEIKEESQAALDLIKTYVPYGSYAKHRITGNILQARHALEWVTLDGAAADFLGAMRWYERVIPRFIPESPERVHLDDVWLARVLTIQPVPKIIEGHIRAYRNVVPPGPDRDQALRILEWMDKGLRANTPTLADHAAAVAIAALTAKVREDASQP